MIEMNPDAASGEETSKNSLDAPVMRGKHGSGIGDEMKLR
jgi:hypothetical protein